MAAFEIMGSNIRVKDAILNGESEGKTFYEIIEAAEPSGMVTFDKFILNLLKEGIVTEDTAMAYASKKAIMGRGIDTMKAEKGEKTTDIEGLAMDSDYEKEMRSKMRTRR